MNTGPCPQCQTDVILKAPEKGVRLVAVKPVNSDGTISVVYVEVLDLGRLDECLKEFASHL